MAQIPPIDDAYINEIIKSNGPYNPALLTTQGLKMRELIKWLRDRLEQGDTEAVHKTGDESISGTKTFTLIKSEGLSVNNLANPSLDTVISPVTGVQTKLLNITEGAFSLQLSASVLAESRSQLLQDKDGIIALTSDLAAFPTLLQFDEGLASKIDITEKGVPGGVSTLDSGGKILASQLPDSISGALTYQGTWDATTNAPALADPPASSTKGYYYVTNTAGTQFGITVAVGDWILSNGTAWEKVDNTDAVTTVFGRLGNILANESDYSAFYPLLTGSYADPSWLTSLDYSKITNAPTNSSIYTADGNLSSNRMVNGGDTTSISFNGMTGFNILANTFGWNSPSFGGGIASDGLSLVIQGSTSVGSPGSVLIIAGHETDWVSLGHRGVQDGNSGVRFHNLTNTPGLDSLLLVDERGVVIQRNKNSFGFITSLGMNAIGAAPNANGATIVSGASSTLTLQPASNSFGGVVTTGTQTFNGAKTFTLDLIVNQMNVGRGLSGNVGSVAFGVNALVASTTGTNNTAIGYNTLALTTTGEQNTAVGAQALDNNTTGSHNVGVGRWALTAITTGSRNTGIGTFALNTSTISDDNTAVGYRALNTSRSLAPGEAGNNTAVGSDAMFASTMGSNNTAIGKQALNANTIGSNNTVIGASTLISNITGNNNTAIGYAANVSGAALTNATAIGSGALVAASNTMQLGDVNVTLINTSGAYQGSQFRLSALNTAPASATAPGTTGEIRVTSTYIYVCTATNTWVRSALTTW